MFDVDGTLIESYDFDENCYIDAIFEVLGHHIDSDWEQYEHTSDAGILNQHIQKKGLLNDKYIIHRKVKNAFVKNIGHYLSQNTIKPIRGASEFLDQLRNIDNVTVSIATGGWRETALLKLEAAGLDVRGFPIASSDDHFSRTEIMKIALQKSGVSNNHSFTYFGDASWDKRACELLEFNFILVGNRIEHYQSIKDFTDKKKIYRFIGL